MKPSWNKTRLNNARIEVDASYEHGEFILEVWQKEIDEMLASRLEHLVQEIRTKLPKVSVTFRLS